MTELPLQWTVQGLRRGWTDQRTPEEQKIVDRRIHIYSEDKRSTACAPLRNIRHKSNC